MLEGEKPVGCTYCWNVESMGPDYISDRKQRTLAIHEGDGRRLKDIIDNPWDMNVNPEYIELSFGNQCNFKCGYCHPRYSSRFFDETKELGPYTDLNSGDYSVEWFENKLYKIVLFLGPHENSIKEKLKSIFPKALLPEEQIKDFSGYEVVIGSTNFLSCALANDSGTGHMLSTIC